MDHPTTSLSLRRVKLDSLHLDPANARAHDQRNLDSIKASLQRFGQAEPLVVRLENSRVIGGNGRVEAMRSLGWTECDVVELDIDETQATALGIALNRTAELAEWDMPALGKLLDSLREEGEVDATGFDDAEIDKLLEELVADLAEEPGEDSGPSELRPVPVTQNDDCWLLGRHKLVCADSADARVFDRLLGCEKPSMVWTDPPYGVAYVGGTKDALTIENDALDLPALELLLGDVFGHAAKACAQGAAWYVAAPAGPNFLPFAKQLTELGIWRQTLVWLKDAFVLGRSDFHYRHEAVFYGWTPGAAHLAPPTRNLDTILEFDRPRVSKDHPTEKPLALVQHCVETSSKRGAIILDPFAGSGTTLIAAESSGRVARCIEVDPRYCDVIVRRWQETTGKQATLDGDERSFDEVTDERRAA